MSIIHMDNFSLYGGNTAFMVEGIYASANRCTLRDDPDGISPGKVLRPSETGGNAPRQTWRYNNQNGAQARCGVAMRVWMDVVPSINDPYAFIQLRDQNNEIIAVVNPNADGSVTFATYESNFVDVIYSQRTEVPVLGAGGWYHMELLYDHVGATTANFELRIEGVTVLEGEGIGCRAANTAIFSGGYYATTDFFYFQIKDLVIWDGTGTDNTDFVGSVLVHTLKPIEDVALNWAPTPAGPGYSILDNVPPDAGQYLDAAYPPPEAYVAETSKLPPDITSVKALMTFVRAAKSDGGDASLQVSIISDPENAPATDAGADRPITVAQTYWRDVSERDPKTNAPWTPAAVDKINIAMDRTV